jgi:hypothetical protein
LSKEIATPQESTNYQLTISLTASFKLDYLELELSLIPEPKPELEPEIFFGVKNQT